MCTAPNYDRECPSSEGYWRPQRYFFSFLMVGLGILEEGLALERLKEAAVYQLAWKYFGILTTTTAVPVQPG